MYSEISASILVICVVFCSGQSDITNQYNAESLHSGLTERIGNFSKELLYHFTAALQTNEQNMIMSPITVWTTLAVISEGASGWTKYEINNALRLSPGSKENTRQSFAEIGKWLKVTSTMVELAKVNALFVDRGNLPLLNFRKIAKRYYETDIVNLNITNKENTASNVNAVVSNFTHGRINKIVDSSYFDQASMVLTSAVYFRGQWTVPFNTASTLKQPFYDSDGNQIGEVNMMYNRYTYPFSNIKELQATVIELPYGKGDRLSMVVMLPYSGVSLENMFKYFENITLDSIFEELTSAKKNNVNDEVDCFIPRFKIESNIDLTDILTTRFSIRDLFDISKARLPYMARKPLYVSKAVHKAEIEVTEEGTTASAVTVAEISNRMGILRFEANRPFTYMIVEKITNTIVFGGFYKMPSLY